MPAYLRAGVHFHQVADFGRIAANKWSIATMLANGDSDLFLPQVIRANPDAFVLLRQMDGYIPRDVNDTSAEDNARNMINKYNEHQAWAMQELGYHLKMGAVCTNEPIQEWWGAEPSREAYELIANYQKRWIEYVKHNSDLAPYLCVDQGWFEGDGPDPHITGYYGFDLYREAARLAEGYVVHGYWSSAPNHDVPPDIDFRQSGYWLGLRMFRPKGFKSPNDPGGVYYCLQEELQGKPCIISECNSGTMPDYNQSDKAATHARFFLDEIIRLDTRGDVMGVTWFLERTGDPQFKVMELSDSVTSIWHDIPRDTDPGEGYMNLGDVYNSWQMRWQDFPALYKKAYAEQLGLPIGAEYDEVLTDGNTYRFLECVGGFVYTKLGEYQQDQIKVIRKAGDVPPNP